MSTPIASPSRATLLSPPVLAGTAVALALCWVSWPTFGFLWREWDKVEASHGYIVPLFAIFLLWRRRDLVTQGTLEPSWWGLALLGGGIVLHAVGSYFYYEPLHALAILPIVAGLFVLVGGWPWLRWSWISIAFLIFMVPLPHRLQVQLAHPLQRIATLSSTYVLQTIGIAAYSEGNIIRIGEIRVNVVEACSGLSMLMIFFALSTAVVILVQRPWIDKVIIFVSAAPIAVVSNIARITVAGILHKTIGSEVANLFHNSIWAALLMMILALTLLWLELRALSWVLVAKPGETRTPMKFGSKKAEGVPAEQPDNTAKTVEAKGRTYIKPSTFSPKAKSRKQ